MASRSITSLRRPWPPGRPIRSSTAGPGRAGGGGNLAGDRSGQGEAARAAGRPADAVTICVAAPAYVGTDLAHQRNQLRWFGGMVGNHAADLVRRYGTDGPVPTALTDYIAGRQGYDYSHHGRPGNADT